MKGSTRCKVAGWKKKVAEWSVRCFNRGQNVLTGWADHEKGAEQGEKGGGWGGGAHVHPGSKE